MREKEHLYGIDLLKILAMFMVVVLHVTSYSGALSAELIGTKVSRAAWLLEASSYCAVDCFAMVTGFFDG